MEVDSKFEDFESFNLEWSLFLAALRSYNSDIYLEKEVIDFASKDVIENLWIKIADNNQKSVPMSEEDRELYNVVMRKQNFRLSLVSALEMDALLQEFHYENNKLSDKVEKSKLMLFKVTHDLSENGDSLDRFSDQYGSFVALHGSPVNRFYSILQNGLHLPKSNDNPGLYGFGIYLTNKLDVALQFAQAHFFNCGWLKDESIKIVALCQVAKHPRAVVRKEHKKTDGFSLGNGIPAEYFLVKDESMVRVSHLLVETSCNVSSLQKRSSSDQRCDLAPPSLALDRLILLFRRNWLMCIILIYVWVLFLVACCKGRCVLFSDWDSSDLLNVDD